MRYAIVIESAAGDFSADVPDLPGCVAARAAVTEVEADMREANSVHVEGLCEDGLAVPAASGTVEYVEVAAWGSPAVVNCSEARARSQVRPACGTRLAGNARRHGNR
jgi:predicted RNase H-like HicB family nuclease